MKLKFVFLLLLLLVISCNTTMNSPKTETKYFGDTLKIVYTYIGDTIFQKRTDLKDHKNTNFSNNFDVKSVWSTKKSVVLNCDQKIKIYKDHFEYTFCLDDILNQTQKQLHNKNELHWSKDDVLQLQKELLDFENAQIDTIKNNNFYMIYHLIRNIKFNVLDIKSNTNVDKIRIENYQTTFSGGHIYYLINQKLDTLAKYHLQDWKK